MKLVCLDEGMIISSFLSSFWAIGKTIFVIFLVFWGFCIYWLIGFHFFMWWFHFSWTSPALRKRKWNVMHFVFFLDYFLPLQFFFHNLCSVFPFLDMLILTKSWSTLSGAGKITEVTNPHHNWCRENTDCSKWVATEFLPSRKLIIVSTNGC